MSSPAYVLVTPARDEAAYITHTLEAVIAQTVLPARWVVVSDGSTDETDEIVNSYAAKYDFIRLVRREKKEHRNFGAKVYAIREGLSHLDGVQYEFIGNVDADVSFEPNYYESIFNRMLEQTSLGIAGGILYDDHDGKWVNQRNAVEYSVGGPIQMFRRACYEDIGGYTPLRRGGVDAIAEYAARMNGWKIRTFEDIVVHHHRATGTENSSLLNSYFRLGRQEYVNAYHPLFEIAKCLSKLTTQHPIVLAGAFRLAGYTTSYLCREERAVPEELAAFIRQVQIDRLRNMLPGHHED